MQAKAQPKTNPQSQNTQGMETFLSQSIPKTLKEEVREQKDKIDEIKEKVEELEKMLSFTKTLDLTTFNNIVYSKKLIFTLLLVRQKIYVEVKDTQHKKSAIVAINPPRWGGSGLRYLVSVCSSQYCKTVEKPTSKGKIITYEPLVGTNNDDDIFD